MFCGAYDGFGLAGQHGGRDLEGPGASLYQISSKSVVPFQRYCDFSNFQDGRRRHLGFLTSRNCIGYWGPEGGGASYAKFRQNWSIGCDCVDIKIFRFFKMAAVRHLGFVWEIFGPPTVSIWGSLSLCKIWL